MHLTPRYRWYVHTDNPTETFVQINAHMKTKATPKFEAVPLEVFRVAA